MLFFILSFASFCLLSIHNNISFNKFIQYLIDSINLDVLILAPYSRFLLLGGILDILSYYSIASSPVFSSSPHFEYSLVVLGSCFSLIIRSDMLLDLRAICRGLFAGEGMPLIGSLEENNELNLIINPDLAASA